MPLVTWAYPGTPLTWAGYPGRAAGRTDRTLGEGTGSTCVHHLWVQLLHVLGVDDVSGKWYAFWSGFAGDITLLIAAVVWPYTRWRQHECLVRWCWRIGHYPFEDPEDYVSHRLCWKHHPDVRHRWLSRARLHLYIGRRPGRG